jgi:hypothetical protein
MPIAPSIAAILFFIVLAKDGLDCACFSLSERYRAISAVHNGA